MSQRYSENWMLLKSILLGYENTRRFDFQPYEEHMRAQALSIFLVHAELATPKLDRETIEDILTGRKFWPNTVRDSIFEGGGITLSWLEENGIISFYANWCSLHCWPVVDSEKIDPSMKPLIQAIEHINDIICGKNGFIKPHYAIDEEKLVKLLTPIFGNKPIIELLPTLILEDGYFKLISGSNDVNSLVSTYLWFSLLQELEPKEAFERWMLCNRIYSNWPCPVNFGHEQHSDLTVFINELISYIFADKTLGVGTSVFWKQLINERDFIGVVSPTRMYVNTALDSLGDVKSTCEITPVEYMPTIHTLHNDYNVYEVDCVNDIHFMHELRHLKYYEFYRNPISFYKVLLSDVIGRCIKIEGRVLESYHNEQLEKLIELSKSRPLLRYILFVILPMDDNSFYLLWLLSRSITCDIALFHLSEHSPTRHQHNREKTILLLDKAYQQVVCHEYLESIQGIADVGERLFQVVNFMGIRCYLDKDDFQSGFHYEFLMQFINCLNDNQIFILGQKFVTSANSPDNISNNLNQRNHMYLIGFKLIERIESEGVDLLGELKRAMGETIINYYSSDLYDNLEGQQSNLKSTLFFASLPWYKIVSSSGANPIIALSINIDEWQKQLLYTNENSHKVASALRHYLLVLMCIGKHIGVEKDKNAISDLIEEISRRYGFNDRETAISLFDAAFYYNDFDLWLSFCSYCNNFTDSLYDKFIYRCGSKIPLDRVFVMLEQSTIVDRNTKLEDLIASRISPDDEYMGLSGIEQAFISACGVGYFELAAKLVTSAKDILSQEHIVNSQNHHWVKVRKAWLSYEYKQQLLELLQSNTLSPEKFVIEISKKNIPHELTDSTYQYINESNWKECDFFRQYISAAAYCDKEPEKCVRIMEHLCSETNHNDHAFMLFKGYIALHKKNGGQTDLQSALSEFLCSIKSVTPENMRNVWIASILDVYRQLNDSINIDKFWMKLSVNQQNRRDILHPYCRSLISRGEPLRAQSIIDRYLAFNNQTLEGLGLNELIDELGRALKFEHPMTKLVNIVNEGSQRTSIQLAKHYHQIVSKDFPDYVEIVSPGKQPHEYLKDIIYEIASELLLRKGNLQQHKKSKSIERKESIRITKEDLINDWFTSLFDKRMAEARVGLRDQKRGGTSSSGNGPGEIDGYITDSRNRRIAIFEAFRLFSVDTTVISEHLNKIAGYDNECLDAIFILAYCDVSDFSGLTRGYESFIATENYTGFTCAHGLENKLATLNSQDNLWFGMESRQRGDKRINIYHLLLDMKLQ